MPVRGGSSATAIDAVDTEARRAANGCGQWVQGVGLSRVATGVLRHFVTGGPDALCASSGQRDCILVAVASRRDRDYTGGPSLRNGEGTGARRAYGDEARRYRSPLCGKRSWCRRRNSRTAAVPLRGRNWVPAPVTPKKSRGASRKPATQPGQSRQRHSRTDIMDEVPRQVRAVGRRLTRYPTASPGG